MFRVLQTVLVLTICGGFIVTGSGMSYGREPDVIINLWPQTPPGPAREVGEEVDITKPDDRLIAGRRIIKLANVSQPQAHVFFPPADKRTGATVVVCPGGGYSILAWDLEGTEVADWLNEHGVTAVVLKYRVPTRQVDPAWLQPVQDAQRCISIVRQNSKAWSVKPDQVGILGFSAGGDTAARTALSTQRHYEPVDDSDQQPCSVNAAMLIYPGYLANDERTGLREDLIVTKSSPPMFLVHAQDDGVPVESSVFMFLALKQQSIPAELHIYDAGGHGYGLRHVADLPVTAWNLRCAEWLKRIGWM